MRRKCDREAQIDALTICYELQDPQPYGDLCELDYGEGLDVGELTIFRTDGRYYDNIYIVMVHEEGGLRSDFGFLKFNISRGNLEANTHTSGRRKVWLTICNRILYSKALHYLTYVEQALGLAFHNVTSLDICIDTPYSIARSLRKLLRSKDVEVVLNGKRIEDRDEDVPEIHYTTSGSLNRQGKYLTICVKQRNALRDKGRGTSLQTYDKAAEIRNASEKEYIMKHYGNPKRLYRTEVHLNASDVAALTERLRLDYTPLLLFDRAALEKMLFSTLESLLRFRRDGKRIGWGEILGRPEAL